MSHSTTTKNHLTRKDLVLGTASRELFAQLQLDPSFAQHQEDWFMKDVRSFFSAAISYVQSKFLLDDKLLENAAVLDTKRRLGHKYSTLLEYFVKKFPCPLPSGNRHLHLEFSKFQSQPFA